MTTCDICEKILNTVTDPGDHEGHQHQGSPQTISRAQDPIKTEYSDKDKQIKVIISFMEVQMRC